MSVEILDLGALALTAVFFALLYYLHKKKQVDFGVRTILAVGLGLIVGLAFKGHHTYVAAVGTIYAHVVSAVVIPLLIFSIISSITNLGNSVRLKQIGLKTVFFLVLNTFIASLITLIAGVATNIGSGVQYELATDYTAKEVLTFVDTVISLFPQNLAAHWSNGEVVPIVVFCISSIVDMARTTTNVVGAATATTLVAATEERLDTAVYNGTVETLAAEA